MRQRTFSVAALAAIAATGLAACGGGGGGSPAPAPPSPPLLPTYTVGGTVSGLAGTGLVLRNNGGNDLAIAANGSFTFTTAVPSGASYSVTVQGQPANPTQTCSVASNSGSLAANVTNVAVTCVTVYRVGGNVTGLLGTGLVLRNNGGDDLAVTSNGAFAFTTTHTSGASYSVAVQTQPTNPTQTCSAASNSGTLAADITNVTVTCVTNTYRIGGIVSGLLGTGLVVRNGNDSIPIGANGTFTFATPVPSGALYSVVVLTHPTAPTQTCATSNAGGTVGSGDVTNVSIKCGYMIGGTVTGLQGSGLVLRNNGSESLSIAADGVFSFPTPLDNGATYDVATFAHPLNPDQECTTTRGTGMIVGADIADVAVNCYVMGRWLYVSNGISGGLSGLKINQATGMLESLPPIPGPPSPPSPRFLFLTNGDAATISGYRVDPAGGFLSELPNSPAVGGSHPIELPTVHPNGGFLYSTDQTHPFLYGYRIDDTTGLTPINGSPYTTAAGTIYARIEPTGRFLYVVTRTQAPVFDQIALSAYSIAPTGELTPVPGTPFAVGTSMPMPGGMELSADGKALFILTSPQGQLYGYTLDATTGFPTPMQGSPFTPPGAAFHLRPHPRLPVLYVGGNNFVAAYRVDTTLTPLAGSPHAITGAPVQTAFDPGARFLYALTSNNGIATFEVGSDGALQTMIGGTLATVPASRMLADPGGRYLFISDFIPGNIQPIAIDTRTGRLSLVQGGTYAGGNGTTLLTIVK